MAKSILIIDDDAGIGNMLEKLLEKEGYRVIRAYSGTEALLLLSSRRPDLILLDLMLPGLSGEEILPAIKEIPVIVVSAKTDAEEKANLLLGGAADYITKPFHSKELLARIAVQFRKAAREPGAVLECGGLRLNLDTRGACFAQKSATLTRTECAVLKLLMQNPSQVIAKSVLLDRIGADSPDCTENSLKVHVSHLRKKLLDISGKDCIESVWGIGFKLTL